MGKVRRSRRAPMGRPQGRKSMIKGNHKGPVVVKPQDIADETIRSAYDDRKTLRQNYQRIGLATVNNRVPRSQYKPLVDDEEAEEVVLTGFGRVVDGKVQIEERPAQEKEQKEVSEVMKALEAKAKEERVSRTAMHHLSENQVAMVVQLTSKYGTDYKAMSRDLKLNPWQHTPSQLRRYVRKYLDAMKGVVDEEDLDVIADEVEVEVEVEEDDDDDDSEEGEEDGEEEELAGQRSSSKKDKKQKKQSKKQKKKQNKRKSKKVRDKEEARVRVVSTTVKPRARAQSILDNILDD